MSIYYALVARGSTILVDYSDASGNFEQITTSILPKISSENTKCTYVTQGYQFHVVVEDGITYLCLADGSMKKRIPYAFLHEIKRRFTMGALKTRAMVCNAYELRRDFSEVLKSQLLRYNNDDFEDPNLVKIQKAQKDVDDVKGIMTKNIDKILERGDKLEILIQKTENLVASAQTFKKQARNLKSRFWWQNTRNCIILIAVIVILLAVITLIVLATLGVL